MTAFVNRSTVSCLTNNDMAWYGMVVTCFDIIRG